METASITSTAIEEARIKRAIIAESLKTRITSINSEIIRAIENLTGCRTKAVEASLYKMHKGGTSGALESFFGHLKRTSYYTEGCHTSTIRTM